MCTYKPKKHINTYYYRGHNNMILISAAEGNVFDRQPQLLHSESINAWDLFLLRLHLSQVVFHQYLSTAGLNLLDMKILCCKTLVQRNAVVQAKTFPELHCSVCKKTLQPSAPPSPSQTALHSNSSKTK